MGDGGVLESGLVKGEGPLPGTVRYFADVVAAALRRRSYQEENN